MKARQILGSCQTVELVVKHEVNADNNCYWLAYNNLQRFGKELGGIEN